MLCSSNYGTRRTAWHCQSIGASISLDSLRAGLASSERRQLRASGSGWQNNSQSGSGSGSGRSAGGTSAEEGLAEMRAAVASLAQAQEAQASSQAAWQREMMDQLQLLAAK